MDGLAGSPLAFRIGNLVQESMKIEPGRRSVEEMSAFVVDRFSLQHLPLTEIRAIVRQVMTTA